MLTDHTTGEMTIESLQLKVEKNQKLITELINENEQLYQQFNHLMVRNTKLLKRIDDMQQIVDDLHIRIQELQLINTNQLKINDGLRKLEIGNWKLEEQSINLTPQTPNPEPQPSGLDLEKIFLRWKSYPAQESKNTPNLRRQSEMLVLLYQNQSLSAAQLFLKMGINGVTGARYVSQLKKSGLVKYVGARKKGVYQITQHGVDFIEKENYEFTVESPPASPLPDVEGKLAALAINDPDL